MRGIRQFEKIHAAFCNGDIDTLPGIPNRPMPPGNGACLEYVIYHSQLPLIRTLLEIEADPQPVAHAGFPPLIAALSCSLAWPGAPAQMNVIEVLRLLRAFGADPAQRGIDDYRAPHMAMSVRNLPAVKMLLAAGADAANRTRIYDGETPREMANAMGLSEISQLLAAHEVSERL